MSFNHNRKSIQVHTKYILPLRSLACRLFTFVNISSGPKFPFGKKSAGHFPGILPPSKSSKIALSGSGAKVLMSRLTIALLDILSYLLDFRSCFFYHYSVDGKSMQSIKNGLFKIAPFLPKTTGKLFLVDKP